MKRKKIKKSNSLTFLLIVFIGLLAIFLIAVYFNKALNINQSLIKIYNADQGEKHESKFLKFSLEFPIDWKMQENTTFTDIVSNNGRINVSRIATNFENISGYLKDFDSKRTIDVSEEKYLEIDNYNAVSRIEMFNGGPTSKQKVYFIYIDNWVYSISTSTEDLFDDLDQIAQSFRYTP